MDLARLVLEYIKVLCWPAVVGVLIIRYRPVLAMFLGRSKRLSFSLAGAELAAEVESLEEQAEVARLDTAPSLLPSTMMQGGEPSRELHEKLFSLTELSLDELVAADPAAAMSAALTQVNRAVGVLAFELAAMRVATGEQVPMFLDCIGGRTLALHEAGLPRTFLELVGALHGSPSRHEIVNDPEVKGAVTRYISICETVLKQLSIFRAGVHHQYAVAATS